MIKKLLIVALVLFASVAQAQISTVGDSLPLQTLGNPVAAFTACATPSVTFTATTTAVLVPVPFPAGTKRVYFFASGGGSINIGNASVTQGLCTGPFFTVPAGGTPLEVVVSPRNLSPTIWAAATNSTTTTTLYILPTK
jgi:hypothetical protein